MNCIHLGGRTRQVRRPDMRFRSFSLFLTGLVFALGFCVQACAEEDNPENPASEEAYRKKKIQLEQDVLAKREKAFKDQEAAMKEMHKKQEDADTLFTTTTDEVIIDGEKKVVHRPTTVEEALDLP